MGPIESQMRRELDALPLLVRAQFPAGLKATLIDMAAENDRLRGDFKSIRSELEKLKGNT